MRSDRSCSRGQVSACTCASTHAHFPNKKGIGGSSLTGAAYTSEFHFTQSLTEIRVFSKLFDCNPQ